MELALGGAEPLGGGLAISVQGNQGCTHVCDEGGGDRAAMAVSSVASLASFECSVAAASKLVACSWVRRATTRASCVV